MLEAKKSRIFENLFALYNKNLLKRRFQTLNVSGFDNLSKTHKSLPLIIYVNHSSWWDGLIIFQILQNFNFENYVMMEERQLKKYPFFRKLGAFSVKRENFREIVKSIEYAVKKLKENSRSVLVIFPQGQIVHNEQRPIVFFNGISKIVEKVENCLLASLSIRIEFQENFKPDIFVKISKTEEINGFSQLSSKQFTKKLATEMTLSLDILKNDILNKKTQNYRNILK